MTPQELKNSILQLAIQGKLVEQRPEEGTAEELYQQIQAEKQALIKAGKLKKEKPLPEITEYEKPLDIPESWKWVRLGDCTSYANTKEKISPHDIAPDSWSLDLEDIEKETGKVIRFCRAKDRNITGDKAVFYKGQILYSKLRPYLKKILVAPENGICTPELVPFDVFGEIHSEYIIAVLKSPHVDYAINAVTYGVKMPRVGTDTMVNLLVPLPPQAEQKRIVAKIEELLPLLDRYELAWNRLEDFNKRFPMDLQKSILQLAIQGKLVPQRPEEGTGEELYQQIQAEKQALIKARKLKKEKPLPEISEAEVPFEIPERWKWCRLYDLCSLIGDIDHNMPKAVSPNEGVLFLSAKDLLDDGTINYSRDVKYISEHDFTRLSRKALPQRNDIIYSRIGAALGKARVVESDIRFLVSYSCCTIRAINVDAYYLRYYLESPLILQHSYDARQSTGVPDLGMGEIKKYIVALPPIAEQKRIVARLEELLPLCEKLK